jgi:hypothetical protein
MSDERRPLDDLIDVVGDDERARLDRVHQLLLDAGPPPELSPGLVQAPAPPKAKVVPLLRRYRLTVIAAAATIALGLFAAGYWTGRDGRTLENQVAMAGPNGAQGMIDVFKVDEAGNWPMELRVSGLRDLPAGQRYALWLTRNGKLADPCGVFAVANGEASVPLNAPFRFRDYTGWVVVRAGSTDFVLRTASV